MSKQQYTSLLEKEDIDLLKEKYKQGFDIESADNYLFRYSCQKGYLLYVDFLYDKIKENITYHHMNKAFQKAAIFGNLNILEYLINKGDVNPRGDNDEALIKSAKKNLSDIVKFLILNCNVGINSRKNSLIKSTVRNKNLELFTFIIEYAKENNPTSVKGMYKEAFSEACYEKNEEIINYLINTEIFRIQRFNYKSIRFLVDKDDLNLDFLKNIIDNYIDKEELLQGVLRMVSQSGNEKIYDFLVKNYDINIASKKGINLKYAIESGNDKLINKMIYSKKFNLFQKPNTITKLIVQMDRYDLLQSLIKEKLIDPKMITKNVYFYLTEEQQKKLKEILNISSKIINF